MKNSFQTFILHSSAIRHLVMGILIIPLVFSCEKALFEEDQASVDPRTNFEYLWKQCNEKYSYFDLKKIDWNEVHDRYSAQLTDSMSDDSLFILMGNMLDELRDGHTNLISDLNISFYPIRKQGPDNFDWRIIEDHYLPANYYHSGPFSHEFIANKQVGYIRFSAFTGQINGTNLNFILNRYKDTKGLIIDLRENGGGAVSDIFELLSHFVDTTTLVNYSRIKTGPGHNDFSEAEPVYLQPSDSTLYLKPVMMLIDRGSYSASSFTSLATKALDNIVLVGDTTGGGLGLPNGGQLPNGWNYRFSITQALTLDMDNSYENGVPPDIAIRLDWQDLRHDEVIDRAIEEILK
ncbi:MAG: S41 family peptidase [Prolixibacteraceae bacterium]